MLFRSENDRNSVSSARIVALASTVCKAAVDTVQKVERGPMERETSAAVFGAVIGRRAEPRALRVFDKDGLVYVCNRWAIAWRFSTRWVTSSVTAGSPVRPLTRQLQKMLSAQQAG